MIDENTSLLEEIYKTTKMGLRATQLIIPKVHSKQLRQKIANQESDYQDIAAKAKQMLRQDGRMPKPERAVQKAVLRSSIQMMLPNILTGLTAPTPK